MYEQGSNKLTAKHFKGVVIVTWTFRSYELQTCAHTYTQ